MGKTWRRPFVRRRAWVALSLVCCIHSVFWSSCFAGFSSQPQRASKGVAILVGVGIIVIWEAFCTCFAAERPTIMAELVRFFLCRRHKDPEVDKRESVSSVLHHQMDEYSMFRPKNHFLSERDLDRDRPKEGEEGEEGASPWEVEELSAGPRGFMPSPDGCVIFFAQHTLTVEASARVAHVVLLRVGNLSAAVSAELATVDGTALAGNSYTATKQKVTFPAGAWSTSFDVEILESPCNLRGFFVVHVEALPAENATMGSSSFCRIRLLPEGLWPPGAPDEVRSPIGTQDKGRRWLRLRLVWAFAMYLLMRRGAKLWYVLASILWLDFHKVVLNTLLLDYALYDFCLTKTGFAEACQRLPLIVFSKLILICIDRFASHVQYTETGSLSSTCFLQEMLIHQYLQSTDDTIEMGKFLHMLSDTVPDSVTYGYKPFFELAHCFNTIVLSILMALFLPMLKGEAPSLETIQPLIWILVPLHGTVLVGLWMRRQSFNYLAVRAREADIEKNGAMLDLLHCRDLLRSYDAAYPVQHVRRAFDDACSNACLHLGNFLVYKGDTQVVARYFGELTKVFGILFGGYAAIDCLHSGKGEMTLGRFTVFLSLYSIIIDVMYMLIEAWDGLVYAGMLVEELCQLANAPKGWSRSLQSFPLDEHPLISGTFVMKLSSSDFYLVAAESGAGPTLEVPLGHCYGIRTYSDASSLRRRACEVLGGLRASSARNNLGCAKVLLLKPTVGLATGTVMENLLSNAAAWVRASDVVALVAVLGIPIPAPGGVKLSPSYKHGANPLELLKSLNSALDNTASSSKRLRRFEEHCERFAERCFASNLTILSSNSVAEEMLQPAEKALFDIARGLLADPEILIAHDILNMMPRPLAQNALQVMVLWQRLGGFKGMVLAFEEAFSTPEGYPSWLGAAGGVSRSLFFSESTIVCAGLKMTSLVDNWLLIQPSGALELCSSEDLSADEQSPTLSLARHPGNET